MPTVNEVIVSNSDDGVAQYEEYYGGGANCSTVDSSHQRIRFYGRSDYGDKDMHWKDWRPYLRFQTIDIPQGATITEAKIQLAYHSDNGNAVGNTVTIRGEATDDASSPASSCSAFGNATRTTASVDWAFSSGMSAGTFYDTPDIKTIVQEIVSRAGWSADNDMQFFFEDFTYNNSNNWLLQFRSKNYSGTTYTPKLSITYSLGEEFTPRAAPAVANAAGPGSNISIQGIQATAVANAAVGGIKETHTPAIASAETQAVLGVIKFSFTPGAANAVTNAVVGGIKETHTPAAASATTAADFSLRISFAPSAASAVANAYYPPPAVEFTPPDQATAVTAATRKGMAYSGFVASAVANAEINILWPAAANAVANAQLNGIKISFAPAAASAIAKALTTYILHTPAAAGADTDLAGLFIEKGFTLTPTAGGSVTAATLLAPRLSSFSITPTAGSSEATAVHSAVMITLAPISRMLSIVNNYEGIIVYQLSSGDVAYVTGMGLTTPALPEANSITNMTHVSNTYDGTLVYQDATGTIKRVDGYGLTESGGL